MQDDMSRKQLSTKIMSTLQQLRRQFPKNISFAIDEYGECNITINKDCGGSNIPIHMLQCRCCKTVLKFAKKFNENFNFLLELDTPLDFLKLSFHDKAHSVMIFNVTVKNNFFDSCGFTELSDIFNPCNIKEDEFRNIVETFYKILGRNPPAIFSNPDDSSIPRMFDDDDDAKYREYRGGAGLQIVHKTRRISRPKHKSKHKSKYKYKNSYFIKKYNRRTKRRMGGGRRK
jgi:hypothetical protein